MYVTRPISRYLDNPQAAAERPPEGPGSGILVVEDKEAVERATSCWGLCRDRKVYGLPFPQNRKLKVEYSTTTVTFVEGGDMDAWAETDTDRDDVVFVPVMDLPLSSNRYYVVRAEGKHIGLVLGTTDLLCLISACSVSMS